MQRSPTNCGINLVRTSSALRRWMACEPLTKRKLSSTTALHANPYPFPRSPDPTPYQIFHLMPDASPNDIKHRCEILWIALKIHMSDPISFSDYELVKLYHPDSAESRRHEPDASRRHAMFSAITRAYASLQKGESGGSGAEGSVEAANAAHMWKRAPTLNRRRYEEPMFVDERWKDRIIWGVLGFVSIAFSTE